MRHRAKYLAIIGSVVLLAAALPAQTTQQSGTSKKSSSASHKTTSHKTAATSKKKSGTSVSKSSSKANVQNVKCAKGKKGCKATKKVRGQQAIDGERAREIQAALIREHYLDGEPTGNFDERTKQALMKYQQDNGWQNKVVPDSRALIKLGLGPSKQGLLNPESAAMASPMELGTEHEIPGGATPSRK